MGNSSQIAASASVHYSTSPYIIKIQEQFNVQVMFRTRPKLHATLVVVKGCEWEVDKVKEATVNLIHHMCKELAVGLTSIISHNFSYKSLHNYFLFLNNT